MINHFKIDMVVAQRSNQRQAIGQPRAVFHKCRRSVRPGTTALGTGGIHAWNVEKVTWIEAIRIYRRPELAIDRQRIDELFIAAVFQAEGPVTGLTEQLTCMRQFQAITVYLLVMSLAVGARTRHGSVVAIVAIHLQVSIIALAIVVIVGIAQLGGIIQTVVGD
ncbi:hypothetical protein D3C75_668750 [compost metagenome]